MLLVKAYPSKNSGLHALDGRANNMVRICKPTKTRCRKAGVDTPRMRRLKIPLQLAYQRVGAWRRRCHSLFMPSKCSADSLTVPYLPTHCCDTSPIRTKVPNIYRVTYLQCSHCAAVSWLRPPTISAASVTHRVMGGKGSGGQVASIKTLTCSPASGKMPWRFPKAPKVSRSRSHPRRIYALT